MKHKHPSIDRIILEIHSDTGIKALTFYWNLDAISQIFKDTVQNLEESQYKFVCRKESKSKKEHLWSKTIRSQYDMWSIIEFLNRPKLNDYIFKP